MQRQIFHTLERKIRSRGALISQSRSSMSWKINSLVSYPYIFGTCWCKPLIFQTCINWSNRINSLKYQRLQPLAAKIYGLENQSLWQKLSSYNNFIFLVTGGARVFREPRPDTRTDHNKFKWSNVKNAFLAPPTRFSIL